MSSMVFALDLGSTKAVCLAASVAPEGGLKVHALASIPCKGVQRGMISDLDAAAHAAQAAIRQVQEQVAKPVDSLLVGVGGKHLEATTGQGFVPIYPRSRHITREDVLQVLNHSRQMVLPPDREMIQALPREFWVDGQRGVQRPIGMAAGKLEVLTTILTGQTAQLQNLERAVTLTGRRIDQMVGLPLASGLGVLSMEDLEAGVMVVDIGGGTSHLAIFVGGSLAAAANLPVSSGHVTSDLSKLLRTSPEEAERLKVQHGAALARLAAENEPVEVQQIGQPGPRALQRRVLCEIIESRMRELATMARQQLERSGLVGMLPGGVVLTGGGSLLPGTDQLFEETIRNTKVRVLEPKLAGVRLESGARAGCAAAFGLARFALEGADDELAPASGGNGWKDRVRTFWSLLSGKS